MHRLTFDLLLHIAGVGGMGGSPSIRRCTGHLMPGIWDRMACGFALALAIGGRAAAADPLPGGKKTVIFEDCSMCIKHRKYRQKWPLGGVGLGLGGAKAKTAPPGGNWFFGDFLIIFDVAFFSVKIQARA